MRGKKLRGGEVVTVQPGLYYPEWGGIRLEDLVWLTPDGNACCITQAPDFLEI
jgi:Xaa-Pro aminopeptidase